MEALNTLSSLGVSWPLVASCGFLWLLVASLHFLSTLTATHGQSLPRYSAGTSRGDGERQHAQEQNETQLSAWNLAPQVTRRVNESFKKVIREVITTPQQQHTVCGMPVPHMAVSILCLEL